MKKMLSVILSAAILVSCCSLAFAAEEKPDLAFAIASDTHYAPVEEALEKTNDHPIFWYANRRAAMDNESGYIFDSFLAQCETDDSVEFVLISGDLTDGGRHYPEQHYTVAEKLRAFEQRSGKEVYVIDGNHDLGYTSNFKIDDFKKVYADFGYDHALTISEDDCSYTANLGDKYRLIAFDSCNHDASTEDGVTAERLGWVKAQADAAKADGRYPILMMHHNLLSHMPLQPIFSKNFIVKNNLLVAEMFADWGIKLVFSGHEHCSDATSYTSALGNVISDFATTSLSMYPIEYRVFSLTENEIRYESKEVEKIDTAALSAAMPDYTPEMLAAMDAGFNEYAKGYLKAGIQYRLERSLSAEKLGIDEDAVYYDIVMNIVGKLVELLNMPLYGENSVQQIAKKYNINIPSSQYKTGWDLATELVSKHYSGSESYALESKEVTILLRTVALILREELSLINDELFWNAANDILENFGIADAAENLRNLGKSVLGSVNAGEYLLIAIVSPLVYGFAYDADGVDDNNGSIAGYGTVNIENNLENIGKNIYGLFDTINLYINLFMQVISRFFASILG